MHLKLTTDEVIAISPGQTVYSALRDAGVFLVASCGSKGICGKCRIRVIEGQYDVASYGKLTEKERSLNFVPACQTVPSTDLFIEIPKESMLTVGDKIALAATRDLPGYLNSYGVRINPMVKRLQIHLPPPTLTDNISDLERLKRAISDHKIRTMRFSHHFAVEMSDMLRSNEWNVTLSYVEAEGIPAEAISLIFSQDCNRRYGLAIDIGTTTIVVYLVDMESGGVIDMGTAYNSQMRHGDDVITRIIYATERNGLAELRDAVVADINTIINVFIERHHIKTCELDSATIAGNTVMSHIFWGLNPQSIREEPYIPAINFFPLWRAAAAGLSIEHQSPVYTTPCVASYVGGDIVAGVLACKMHRNQEIAFFIDIGTNGEIVIGNNEWLITAACSAGPCFEGSGIRCGIRATPGAIEAVTIDRHTLEPAIKIIGNGKPLGICGSGMIDAIAELFLSGIIDKKGRFIRHKTSRIREGEEGIEYVFCSDEAHLNDIVLTEVDIENIMRAKAAIYGGMTTLLNQVGFGLDAIKKVYIGGGFGNYLNVEKAIIIGMLPDAAKERFIFMGNTSITGSYLCLLSDELRQEAEAIASKMTYMELSVMSGFMDQYMSALFLPHTDMNQFPTVVDLLRR